MINTLSYIWIFLISISSCKNEISIKEELNYSLILKVYEVNNKNYIDADYVQYLTGDRAIEEAKKNDDVDIKIINGQKKYSIPNDFYIVNDNNKVRKLELSENVKIDLANSIDLKTNDSKSIFNYFKNNYDDKVYLIVLSGEKVTEIKEIFTP